MNRYLITTADERSWKFDRPVLFLGEWCRSYDRKDLWSKMDAVVAEPYGLGPGQKLRDTEYIQDLSYRILPELTEALNNFHQTRHSERYWNIVLGHWLQRYVGTVFNRYQTLDQALKAYEVSGTTVFDAKGYSLATTDSLIFIRACNDSVWNNLLYSKLMAYRGDIEMNREPISLPGIKRFHYEHKASSGRLEPIKKPVRELVSAILPGLARDTDAFIINSYLSRKEEIKLYLALGQLPQLWRSPSYEQTLPDDKARARLTLDYDKHKGLERYVRWQLPELIPTCYLEGYKSLVRRTEALPWPKNPKFIFTSNNFDTDEVFKVWAGSKADHGVPYFIGQHGNNYGTMVGNAKWPERVIADKFLTWGWIDETKNSVPAFIFTTAARKPGRHDPDGGVLLVEASPHFRFLPTDEHYEFGTYQKEQFRFVENLPAHIGRELTVRLHLPGKHMGWFYEERWKDRSPNTRLETGEAGFWKLVSQSRLVVYSYDSTGMLETFSFNIPTICFWYGGLNHILPDAKPYYELLRSAGILLDTPEEAAKAVALHWDDIGEWWGSKKVQDARKAFCARYARAERRPVRTLKRLLK